jgi:zinc transporter
MRAFVFSRGIAAERPFAEAKSAYGPAGITWLHIDGSEPGASDWVAAQADIPAIVQSALLASETRPRSDVFGSGALLNLRGLLVNDDGESDALASIRIWAEEGRCISLSYRDTQVVEDVISRFLGGRIQDPGDLLAAFADANTDRLDPEVAHLGDSLDECELKLGMQSLFVTRRKVARIRADAISFRRFIAPQRPALERLAQAPLSWLDDTDRGQLRDAADRAARMTEELEAVRERAALMHEEITDRRAEQMDARALLIAIVALVFLPLTFITGLLGMNVEGIPFKSDPWAFWGVVGFCAAVGIAMTIYFIRAHWIIRN